MWKIMQLLNLLPDFVWHSLLIVSLIIIALTYFLPAVPVVGVNAIQLRVVAIVLLVVAVWMAGGIANETKWQERVRVLESRVAVAEKKAVEANSRIETVYVDRVQVVKEVQYVVRKEIQKSANELDANCRILPGAIDILNQAAGVKK
jgi:NADH:ubiquinone oxidoreductase subunit 6 (subunit J)